MTALRDGKAAEDRWHMRQNGSRFWINGVIRALHDSSGSLRGSVRILRDLTAQRHAQEPLQRSDEQLRLLIDNVTDYALIQVDRHGSVSCEHHASKDGWTTEFAWRVDATFRKRLPPCAIGRSRTFHSSDEHADQQHQLPTNYLRRVGPAKTPDAPRSSG